MPTDRRDCAQPAARAGVVDVPLMLAVGIFGSPSEIGDRVGSLLQRGRTFTAGVSRARVGASAVALAGLIIGGALMPQWIAFAQQTDSFEVASIKINQSGNDGSVINFPETGRLTVTNASLKTLIRNAYGVQSDQIVGGPQWLDRERFDIQAKTSGPIHEQQEGRLMQSLLAERFHLKVHQDTRELPIYAMTLAPGGPKFKEHVGETGFVRNSRGAGKAQFNAARVSLQQLAGVVGRQTGRIIENRTGLRGYYDFNLTWDPDQTADSEEPSIFVALKQQLGLNLTSAKGPVMVIIIDHAEKPDAN